MSLALDLFKMGLHDFEYLRRVIRERTGISLSDAKRDLVRSRFSPHLANLNLKSFQDYREYLERLPDKHDEWQTVTNLITTNKTEFFREPAHFDFLADEFIPKWRKLGRRTLTVWSAACSTGEEPY